MKPIIKYRGGKSKEIANFIQFVPNDYVRYVEPFAGGAALFFYLEPRIAILNDINSKLVDFYLAVQNNYEQLKKELTSLELEYRLNQADYEILKATRMKPYIIYLEICIMVRLKRNIWMPHYIILSIKPHILEC